MKKITLLLIILGLLSAITVSVLVFNAYRPGLVLSSVSAVISNHELAVQKKAKCVQAITLAVSPKYVCKKFKSSCDVPKGWKKVTKCPRPAEIKYYTCPNGKKVESGKCYGKGETFGCAMLMNPELKCPAPKPSAPAVAKVGPARYPSGKCAAGEVINYKCADGTSAKWCVCDDLGWNCPIYKYPQRLCPAAKETTLEIGQQQPSACAIGEALNYKCSDDERIFRACICEKLGDTGETAWECGLEPFCPKSGPPTVFEPHISGAVTSDLPVELQTTPFGTVRITWFTSEPATSRLEYGLSTSYGSTAGTDYFGSTYQGAELSNVQPDTTYHFRITTRDHDITPNTIVTGDYTFILRRLPDLSIQPISVDHFKADTPNKIHVSIHNNGVVAAAKGFVIKVYAGFVDSVLLVEGTYDSDLAAGATGEKIFDYTFSGDKNYSEIKATVDATNLVTELIENNNDFHYGISIYPPAGQ